LKSNFIFIQPLSPNDRRHYFTFSGAVELPYGLQLAPILTLAPGVPMDILLPNASSRIPIKYAVFHHTYGTR
jgi:hypothetical protein